MLFSERPLALPVLSNSFRLQIQKQLMVVIARPTERAEAGVCPPMWRACSSRQIMVAIPSCRAAGYWGSLGYKTSLGY